MQKLTNFLLFISLSAMVACGNNADVAADETQPQVVDGHNASNALDYAGAYKGTLPCADCEGIETILTLAYDGTYQLSSKYIGKGDGQPFVSQGKFSWRPDGSTIELEGETDGAFLYFVGENRLWQLDMEGKRIEGSLAEKYILEKVAE